MALVTHYWDFKKLFVTKFQYRHCVRVYFNAVHLLYGIMLNKSTPCDIFNSAKQFHDSVFTFRSSSHIPL